MLDVKHPLAKELADVDISKKKLPKFRKYLTNDSRQVAIRVISGLVLLSVTGALGWKATGGCEQDQCNESYLNFDQTTSGLKRDTTDAAVEEADAIRKTSMSGTFYKEDAPKALEILRRPGEGGLPEGLTDVQIEIFKISRQHALTEQRILVIKEIIAGMDKFGLGTSQLAQDWKSVLWKWQMISSQEQKLLQMYGADTSCH